MEATGYSHWFERLLADLGFELWIGDPAEIKAKRVKKQKFDREDTRPLLRLLRENNVPQIWVSGQENRDLRQLLWHRHRLVQVRAPIAGRCVNRSSNLSNSRSTGSLSTEHGTSSITFLSDQSLVEPKSRPRKTPKPFMIILEWRAQGDDFRTFLADFVVGVTQVELPARLRL
jgi:hypothetical protein